MSDSQEQTSQGVKSLKATWPQALASFFLPLLIILTIRFFLIEPFTIPSGSMVPTLLIHDHIFVNKLSFGVSFPWSQKLALSWGKPKRGDIVVFRFPETPHVFYVKRVVATAGDEIEVIEGILHVNGEAQPQVSFENNTDNFDYYTENLNGVSHVVRYHNQRNSNHPRTVIPEGNFYVIGDNRDQSYDSRSWGPVPENLLVGKALFIWLSCAETLPSASYICDPQTIRWNRIFRGVH